ncbi:MAG TPA: FAD-binding oxidoreductase, partial [Beijerinckiaceae bacterium]|nr:FAD-binding oxidoreductase [Beijerinckiaceae bacterium]
MSEAAAELKSALGPRGWLEGEAAVPYTRDIRGAYSGHALLVARPGATEEVARTLAICRRHGLCVTPQGGNTGLVGASVPSGAQPSIVLSLARMNRVLSVDPARYTITVEAGCILERAHEAAAQVDRTFAMDWGARGSATVGGGISTNAGGINVLRFGVTRDQVLGLEVVLPDGRVWDGMRALRKDSSGYDLKHLFIGAEGTLGIVTKAVLKLYPRPREERSMFLAVADLDRLMEIFTLARDIAGHGLTAFELIPGASVELALAKYPSIQRPLQTRADWYALVRFSGGEEIGDLLAALFERAQAAGLVTDAALAQSSAQERNLWTLRDEIPPLKLMQGKMLKWDAAVPIDRIVPFLRTVERCAAERLPGARVYAFGHVGDGNLHLSVWPSGTPGEAGFDALCAAMERAIDELVWSFGGTICAEHGVGVENFARLVG